LYSFFSGFIIKEMLSDVDEKQQAFKETLLVHIQGLHTVPPFRKGSIVYREPELLGCLMIFGSPRPPHPLWEV
jgi:hypothetical protein